MTKSLVESMNNIGESLQNWERANQLTEINKTFIPEIAKTAFWTAKEKQRNKKSLEEMIVSGKLSVVEQ